MKITHIRAESILGLRYANLQINAPVVLFCGQNFAGKSSLQESVRMALCGETVRVSLKKDYSEMVSDGAKAGFVEVSTDTGYGRFELPKGTHTLDDKAVTPALAYVLNAQRFAKLDDDARREFLFKLTGCGVEADDIRRRLREKGCDADKIEATVPMLLAAKTATGKRAGFPEASAAAAARATEAKGAWRQVTGEVWGSLKGKDWKADAPEVDQTTIDLLTAEIASIEGDIADVNTEISTIDRAIVTYQQSAAEQDKRKTLIARLPNLRAKLEKDQAELAEWEVKLKTAKEAAGQVQRLGLVHELARFIKVAGLDNDADIEKANALWDKYVREHGEPGKPGDPEAAMNAQMYLTSRNLMASSVTNDQRDIAAAETAQAQFDIVAAQAKPDEELRERLIASRTSLRASLDAAKKSQDKLLQAKSAAENAATKTANAATHHKDIAGWLKVADALAADGIPAELLAQALKPINSLLRASATVTEWAQVTIDADMTIRSSGRRYSLLSESEQWRADAMIAAAIAEISGARILMLDRFDVLDLPGREDLIVWLDTLTANGQLDTALIFGTMKAEPKGLPASIQTHWITNSSISNVEQIAA